MAKRKPRPKKRKYKTEDLLADSVSEIREDFQERGFYAVDVQYDVRDEEEGQEVVFLLERGRVVKVGKVKEAEVLELPTADRDWLIERIGQQRGREAKELEKAGKRR